MERERIEAQIRAAFEGVRLGSGVSLRQAQAIDSYSFGLTQAQFEALKQAEVTDDWTRVPEDEVAGAYVAHLDADGLRFYLPALMLWMLDHYDDEDLDWSGPGMTIIGTMIALAPKPWHATSQWDMFETFTPEQRTAVASYLQALPRIVHLCDEDAASVAESVELYWAQFLPRSH